VSPSSSSPSVSCIPPKLHYHPNPVAFGHRELEFELLRRASPPAPPVLPEPRQPLDLAWTTWIESFSQSNKTITVNPGPPPPLYKKDPTVSNIT
jgi:hypothetical protein